MASVLRYVAGEERLNLPKEVVDKIVDDSNGNMRKALLVMEALKMQS